MKFEPKKVFVLENGKYIELTYQEFCLRCKTEAACSEKHFIPLYGMLMEVTGDAYREFYKCRRRQKYLDERSEKNGDYSYDMLTASGFNGEDILVDVQDVAETVVERIMLDKLRLALSQLPEDEKLLIHQHFFEGISQVELGRIYGIHQSNISRRIVAILKKLKEML